MSLLAVKNLTVKFDDYAAVDDVSFELTKGDTLAIVGPNGSGKSTLMKAILGLVPSTGTIRWSEGVRIGYVPQSFLFDRDFPLTVYELFLTKLRGASFWRRSAKSRHEVLRLLREVHAEQLIEKQIGQLSGGELQRVFIAFALANDPQVLFFDEPSSGIDVGGEETIYTLLHELSVKKGLTIVLISHDLDIVYEHANSVLCINRKLICRGIPHEMLTRSTLDKLYGKHAGVYEHEEKSHQHKRGHKHHEEKPGV